jgi:hypothetical protein
MTASHVWHDRYNMLSSSCNACPCTAANVDSGLLGSLYQATAQMWSDKGDAETHNFNKLIRFPICLFCSLYMGAGRPCTSLKWYAKCREQTIRLDAVFASTFQLGLRGGLIPDSPIPFNLTRPDPNDSIRFGSARLPCVDHPPLVYVDCPPPPCAD